MKLKILLSILLFALCASAFAQWSNHSLSHNGVNRNYAVYLPNNYNASNPASLVVTLHGLGDTVDNFKQIGFARVADTTNYIVVAPQAVADIIAGTAWNSGAGIFGYYPNSNVDDIGFLNTLISIIKTDYSVNPDQVFMCGYSMGGFMTQKMACASNSQLAAVASVAGTIGSAIQSCNPGRALPVAHFHGTSDGTVGYYDNSFGIGVDDLIAHWVVNNSANPTPTHTALPNIANDGYTVDHYLYEGVADVELFKVNGADHVWLKKPANDIDYAQEIIRFFNKTHEQLSVTTYQNIAASVYPNPTSGEIFVKFSEGFTSPVVLECYDVLGKEMFKTQILPNEPISLKDRGIRNGVYILKLRNESFTLTERIILK